MSLPRTVAKWLARIGGYFWLPCPACREMTAGFEAKGPVLWETASTGKVTCGRPRCRAFVDALNSETGFPWLRPDEGEER